MGASCSRLTPAAAGEGSHETTAVLEEGPRSETAPAENSRPSPLSDRPLRGLLSGAMPKVVLAIVVIANIFGLWHVVVSGRHAAAGKAYCASATRLPADGQPQLFDGKREWCEDTPHKLADSFFDLQCLSGLGVECALGEVNDFMEVFANDARPIAQLLVAPELIVFLAVAQFGKVPVPSSWVGTLGFTLWTTLTCGQWALGLHTLMTTVGTFLVTHHRFLCCARPWAPDWWPDGPRLIDVVALATAGVQPSMLTGLALALMHPLALMAGLQAARHAASIDEHTSPIVEKAVDVLDRVLVRGAARVLMWLSLGLVLCSVGWTVLTLGAIAALALAPGTVIAFAVTFFAILPLVQYGHRHLVRFAGDDFVDTAHNIDGTVARREMRVRTPAQNVAAAARDALHWIDPSKTDAVWRRVWQQGQLPRSTVTLFFGFVIVAQLLSAPLVFGVWSAAAALGSSSPGAALGSVLPMQYAFLASEVQGFRLTIPWQLLPVDKLAEVLANPRLLFPSFHFDEVYSAVLASRASLTLGLILATLKFGTIHTLRLSLMFARFAMAAMMGTAFYVQQRLCMQQWLRLASVSELTWRAEGSAHVQPRQVLGQGDISFRALKGFGDEDVRVLSEYLAVDKGVAITVLAISDCRLTDAGTALLVEALAERELDDLELYSNEIGDGGAASLSQLLRTHLAPPSAPRVRTPSGLERLTPPSAQPPPPTLLRSLDLSHNRIGAAGAASLAAALSVPGSTLTMLDLYGNSVRDAGARSLAAMLETNVTLEVLDLGRNNIEHNGAISFSEVLRVNSTLKRLDLSHSLMRDRGAIALARALRTANSTLTELDLSHSEVGDEGAIEMARMLGANTMLTDIDLGNNRIGDRGAAELSAQLRGAQPRRAIAELDLGSNNIGGTRGLADLIRSDAVKKLDLEFNDLGASGASDFARALRSNRLLVSLDLRSNKVGDEGASELADALASHGALHTLDLAKNGIGVSGAERLAHMLRSARTLTHLNLDDNSVGDDGATALAKALGSNATLELLDLSDNGLGAAGVSELAAMLRTNAKLKTLRLRANQSGREGVHALAEALCDNSTLLTLDLSENPLGGSDGSIAEIKVEATCVHDLARMLKRNGALTQLDLSDTRLHELSQAQVRAAWRHEMTGLKLGDGRWEEAKERLSIAGKRRITLTASRLEAKVVASMHRR